MSHNGSEQDLSEMNVDKIVGNYQLGKTIGKGTFGKVKVGTHKMTGEKVALKILDKSKMEDETDLNNVQREISILKAIRHRNIIQLYEIIEEGDLIYFIMEFAEGGDFFDFISRSTRFSEQTACVYFHQIISAVEYIHSMNIVHRDLKPENLLLDYKNNLKLSDFGLSSFYTNEKLLTTPCGTPNYAPPEMLRGEEYHGLFSDIWSCGVILYAMLCGYLPFGESNEDLLSQHIIRGDIEIPDFLSLHAIDLLHNMLNINPMERYDLEQIKAHPWFNTVNYVFIPGIYLDSIIIPVDEVILDLIEVEEEEEKEKIKEAVRRNEFNEYTTSYYLMVKKLVKEAGTSISDLCSKEYLSYINDPRNMKEKKEEEEVQEEKATEHCIEESKRDKEDVNSVKSNASSEDKDVVIDVFEEEAKKDQEKKISIKRKSVMEFYGKRSFKENIENAVNNHINESRPSDVSIPPVPKSVQTKLKRTDGGRQSSLFLEILEKQTLKEFEEGGNEAVMDNYIKRKSMLENFRRASIKVDFKKLHLANVGENKTETENSPCSSPSRSAISKISDKSNMLKIRKEEFESIRLEVMAKKQANEKPIVKQDSMIKKPFKPIIKKEYIKKVPQRPKKATNNSLDFVDDVAVIPVPKNEMKLVKQKTKITRLKAGDFQQIKYTKYTQPIDENHPPKVKKVYKCLKQSSIKKPEEGRLASVKRYEPKTDHTQQPVKKKDSIITDFRAKHKLEINLKETIGFHKGKTQAINFSPEKIISARTPDRKKYSNEIRETMNKRMKNTKKSQSTINDKSSAAGISRQNNYSALHTEENVPDSLRLVHLNSTGSNITSFNTNKLTSCTPYLNTTETVEEDLPNFYTERTKKKIHLGNSVKADKTYSTTTKKQFNNSINFDGQTLHSNDYNTPYTLTMASETKRAKKYSIYTTHNMNLKKINQQFEILFKNKEKLKDDMKTVPEFMKYLDTKNASRLQEIKNKTLFEDTKQVSTNPSEKESLTTEEKTLRIYDEKIHPELPIDPSFCFFGEITALTNKLLQALKRFRFVYIQKSQTHFRCHRESLHLGIDIIQMKEVGVLYLKFKRVQGTFSEYNQTIRKILNEVK